MKTDKSIFVDSDLGLKNICDAWQDIPILAMDTEFIRTNTFYPIPALIQAYDGSACYLIDPMAISDFEPLRKVMLAENTVKVFHSCSEDLEVFDKLFKTLPAPLFDTQIAAAFLGYGFSAGYARLIKTLYNIEISKDETRSDWLQRPLTENQLTYAAADVIHLYTLYEKLSLELKGSEKSTWVDSCNQELSQQFHNNQDPAQYFLRIKNSWRLNQQQQHILFHLSLWREDIARSKNKPRSHILNDEALFELSLKQPTTGEALKKLTNLSPNGMKYHGQDILALLNSLAQAPSNLEHPLWQMPEQPLPREAGQILKHLKNLTDEVAERINVASEMLARKKDFQALVSSAMMNQLCLPDSFQNWRQPVIGNLLLEATQQWRQQNS